MALTWDVTKVADYKELWPDKVVNEGTPNERRKWNSTTEAIVFGLLFIGIREITAKNCKEVFCRLAIHEQVSGALRIDNASGENHYFTPQEVQGHIGMTSNVSGMSLATFKTKVYNELKEKQEKEYDKHLLSS